MSDVREIRKLILKVSWPMIVSELTESLYSLADTFFVSKLGKESLAGVGVATHLSWLLFGLTSLFSVGSLIYVAQAYGAGKIEKARTALGTVLPVTLLVTIPTAILVILRSETLISLLAGEKELEVVREGALYLGIRVIGLPIMAVAICFDASLRAVGATKYSMVAMVTSALLNVVLDPIMIFGLLGFPRMGVAGAALATVLSIAYTIPITLLFLKQLNLLPILRFDKEILLRLVTVGVPVFVERLIFSIGNTFYIAVIARCGATAMAAHQVGIRIESLIFMPGFAFSIAASSLVGQSVGAGKYSLAKRVGYEVSKVALIYMTLLGVAVALFSRNLAYPFSSDEEVLDLAAIYLVLAGLSEPGLALSMVLGGAVRGAGNTVVPLVINAACLYLIRVAPSLALVHYLGVVGAWIAMAIDVYVRGLLVLVVYAKFYERLVKKLV
ncbi:MAG: MATE family efflux transporter [Sulfolobales archaeon]